MSAWSPAFLLGILLSVVYASLYHLWSGRHLGDLMLALPVTTLGFGVGQFVGLFLQTPLFQIGQLHVFEATIGAWGALFVVRLLTMRARD
jgi:hypothetical protein